MLAALLNQIESNRKVVCITGNIGAGKTLSMSVLANSLRDIYNAQVFSNYALKNSQSLKEVTHREQVKIVCIDEIEAVWQWSTVFINDLLSDKEQNTIFIITAFFSNRLPEEIKKLVDITLEVKNPDFNTIKIKGINNHYEHEIYILNESNVYNAFEPAELSF
jgi:predicted AAA+ superfamily ATPase